MSGGALIVAGMTAVVLAGCGYDDGRPDAGRPGPPGLPGRIDAGGLPDLPSGTIDAEPGSGEVPQGPACSNGVDDDCDGLIDFAGGDPGCASPADTSEKGLGLVCDDGLDNDGDGRIDFVVEGCGAVAGDPGCTSPSDQTEREPGPL
jgi:hypothetical protein